MSSWKSNDNDWRGQQNDRYGLLKIKETFLKIDWVTLSRHRKVSIVAVMTGWLPHGDCLDAWCPVLSITMASGIDLRNGLVVASDISLPHPATDFSHPLVDRSINISIQSQAVCRSLSSYQFQEVHQSYYYLTARGGSHALTNITTTGTDHLLHLPCLHINT